MANPLFGGVNLKTLGWHNGIANVRDYGAKSNDVYDNTGVVQAVIDGWEAINGGKILFPSTDIINGRYRFTAPVTNDDDEGVVSFYGSRGPHPWAESKPPSVLWLDSTTADAHIIRYAAAQHTGGMTIEDLHFQGNTPFASAALNQSGVLFDGRCGNHLINRCGFQYFTGYAIAHDPTNGASYNQNSAIRDTHFWSVAGCFGPTVEYADGALYLFNTLYTIDNVGLDHGLYAGALKPYIWDLRATRSVVFPGNWLIEGAGVAGMTACVAVAGSSLFVNGHLHFEIVSNAPTYMMAVYGTAGAKYNSSGEKVLKFHQYSSSLPMWIQDDASNEVIVHIEECTDYDTADIDDIIVWENGVEVNKSGHIEIERLHSKTFAMPTSDKYAGRVKINHLMMDQQGRHSVPAVGAPRKLLSWNPSQGYPFRNWGEGAFQDAPTSCAWTIKPDGRFWCLSLVGKTSPNTIPAVIWRFGKNVVGFGNAEDYAGGTISFAMKYKYIVDPTDSTSLIRMVQRSPPGWTQFLTYGDAQKNLTEYVTAYAVGSLKVNTGSDIYDISFTWLTANPTLPTEIRILAFEAWLGVPDQFDLEPASVASSLNAQAPLPTFVASDATPSVGGCPVWKTNTGTLTITDLDDFPPGEERTIISKGAITFDTTSTNLKGSTVDIVTASGDITKWVSDDANLKTLTSFVKAGIDNSGGA